MSRIANFLSWRRLNTNQEGYALPIAVMLLIFTAAVAYASLLQANNGLNLASKESYTYMARLASKSAIDYAQERYNNDTSYTGTGETTIHFGSAYKVTFQAVVVSTDLSVPSKVVRGIGRVYVPADASTQQYKYDFTTKSLRPAGTSYSPPQASSLFSWHSFNNNGVEQVTGIDDYRVDALSQYGYDTSSAWGGRFGNTHSLDYSGASGSLLTEASWKAEWTPAQGMGAAYNRLTAGGSMCGWLKSDDGDNDLQYGSTTVTGGERPFAVRVSNALSPTHFIVGEFLMDSANANRWTMGFRYDGASAGSASVPTTAVPDKGWHQHCATITDSGSLTYFIDGVSRATASLGSQHNPFQTGWYITGLEGGVDGTRANSFNGRVDELMVWKTVLTPAEILDMYTALK